MIRTYEPTYVRYDSVMDEKTEAAVALVNRRWAGTTPEERREALAPVTAARLAKRQREKEEQDRE